MKINEIDRTSKEELGNYIKENLSKGYSINSIKSVLIGSGLEKSFVDSFIENLFERKVEKGAEEIKEPKKELDNYIKENLSKGYSISSIKSVLINSGLEKSFVSRAVRSYYVRNVLAMPISVIMVVLLVSSLLVFRLMTVGLAPTLPPEFLTIKESYSYIYPANLTLNESSEYIWFIGNYGNLKSIRLDGSISKEGSAKVYLEYENKEYLIFDSSRLSKEVISEVTGLAVGDIINQSSLDNESEEIIDVVKEGEPLINDSLDNNLINKKIIITTQGGGRKDIEEIFEFNISSEFNWDVGYSKVCTKWDINSVSLCYGAEECCALINLESSGNWNSSFYLSYGRYSAGLSNTVRAQVIYANYSLDIEHPYADIVYSNINELEAEFYKAVIRFNDICIETCELPGFNATEYRLAFVIENATLKIDNIRYTIEKEINISRNAPVLVKKIENITMYKNEDMTINLSEYFYDEDGDKLNYTGYEVDNITLMIKDSIARIVPSYNFTGRRYMYFTASDGYYKASSDIFLINVIEKPLMVGEVNVSEELIKPMIVINQPVKWVKRVNASARVINLSINISSDALNVTVRNVKEDRIIQEDKMKINDKGVIKNASAYRAKKRIEQIKKIGDRLDRKKMKIIMERPTDKEGIANINKELLELKNERNKLTGYVVVVREKGLLTKFFEWLFNVEITGYVVAEPNENETLNVTSVIIEDIVEEVEIEYYTEAPVSEERNITNGKSILISSDVHYEDVGAYTYLNDVPQSSIRLYRIVNESRELVNNISYSDENNNSLIDKIGWIVPSLSNETYEVIYIIKAVHLNESRDIISDVYGYVKELDGNWSESIYSGEYVRVTFEIPLDNTKDITIYPRVVSGEPRIEVYEVDGSEKIAEFTDIKSNEYNKVYLTELQGEQDIFDLRVVGGSLEIEHIIDPVVRYLISGYADATATGTDSGTSDNLHPGGKNVVRLDNGRLIAFWKDNSAGVRCKHSDDNGVSWVSESSIAGNFKDAAIATNGSRIIYLFFTGTGNQVNYIISEGGCDLSGGTSRLDAADTDNLWKPDVAYNKVTNMWVACTVDSNSDDLWYANSSTNQISWTTKQIATGNYRTCSIDVDDNGNVFIAGDNNQDNVVHIFNSSDNFQSIIETTINKNPEGVHLSIRGKEILITYKITTAADLGVSYSYDGVTYTNSELAGSFDDPEGCIDSSGNFHIAVRDERDGEIKYVNYDIKMVSFGQLKKISDVSNNLRYPSVRCTNFPENNRMDDDELQLVYTSASAPVGIYFGSYGLAPSFKEEKVIYFTNDAVPGDNTKWLLNEDTAGSFDSTTEIKYSSPTSAGFYLFYPGVSRGPLSSPGSDDIDRHTLPLLTERYWVSKVNYTGTFERGNWTFKIDVSGEDGGKADYVHVNVFKCSSQTNSNTCTYLFDATSNDLPSSSFKFMTFNSSEVGPFEFNNEYLLAQLYYQKTSSSNTPAKIQVGNVGKESRIIPLKFYVSKETKDCLANMTSYWTLDDEDVLGGIVYDVVDGNDGLNNGSKTGQAGKIKEAFVFDGINDFIEILDSDNLDISGNFTLVAWINANVVSGTEFIVGKWSDQNNNRSYGMWISGSNLSCGVSLDGKQNVQQIGNTSENVLASGGWYHVACVFNADDPTPSNRMKAYVNGSNKPISCQGGCNFPSSIIKTKANATIGNHKDSAGSYTNGFNGTIDEVAIFNRALSDSEILQLYQKGLAGKGYCGDLTPPGINFTAPTPANGSVTPNKSIEINVSIVEENLGEVKFNWNNVNYTIYDESLILMYNFDNRSALGENDTRVVDLSGKGNNGTAYGGTDADSGWIQGGKSNGAWSFDGYNDYISTNLNINTTQNINLSFCGWINFQDYPGGVNTKKILYDYSTTIQLQLYSTTYLIFDVYNSFGDGGTLLFYSTPINNNIWHHVCGIRNDTSKYLSVDGSIVSTESYTGGGADHTGVTFSVSTSDTTAFNGIIDDVMIFNRSLSADEIQQLYFTNLYKYNQTQWYLYINQSKNSIRGLDFGKYNYSASAKDMAGNENMTEMREITIEDSAEVIGCRVLEQANKVYTLINNVTSTGTCFNITANNITLDCQGYEINYSSAGTLGYGVYSNKNFTTIKNCKIKEGSPTTSYKYAIYFVGAKNGTIDNNTITTSGIYGRGIYLSSSSNSNTLSNNTITTSGGFGYGIYLYYNSNSNTISNNTITTSGTDGYGIYLYSSSNSNTLSNNTITTSGSFGNGIYLSSSSNSNTLSNNTITTSGTSGYGILLSLSSNSNTLSNNTLATSGSRGYGIYLASSSNSNILSNNTITTSGSSGYGIYLSTSSNNILMNNNIWNCTSDIYGCLYLYDSDNNTILGGVINQSNSSLIYLKNSKNNLFKDIKLYNSTNDSVHVTNSANNTFDNLLIYSPNTAKAGIYSDSLNTTIKNSNITMKKASGGNGIYLYGANNSYVYNNSLNEQYWGLSLSSTSYTKIENNTVNSNSVGISLDLSSNNNILTGNTVINSSNSGILLSSSSNNILTNNTANYNLYGIYLSYLPSGSNNNILTGNTANSNSEIGISLSLSSNNILTNNTANSDGYGIALFGSSNSILTGNNIWNCTTTSYGCLYLSDTNNNTISGGIINKSEYYLISINNGKNNLFKDILLINASKNDTYLGTTSTNNTFLNVSYNISKEYVDSTSELIRKWYYQAYVNDTKGSKVANANVSFYDKNNFLTQRWVTNSSGWINRTEIIDYVNYGGVRNFYSPYTITAVNKSSVGYHRGYNVSFVKNNLNDVITIDVEYPRIEFKSPEPDYIIDNYWIYVNVSANDTYSNISTFIDFDNSLVGWWRFDYVNTTGLGAKVYDNSSYGNNGTAYGDASQIDAGYLGKGFSFDGNGDYLNFGSPTSLDFNALNINYTYSGWFRATNIGTGTIIDHECIGDVSGLSIQINSQRLKTFDGYTYSFIAQSSTLSSNTWYHFAVIYNNSQTRIYINGVADGSGSGSFVSEASYNFLIGDDQVSDCGGGFFNGTIDDVMIFNRILSANEIRALYTNQSSRYLGVNFTGLSDSSHTIKAYSQDIAGNVNSTETMVNIQNLPPSIPELLKPDNNDNTLIDRYVYFNWTDSVDNRNEPITYEINLTNKLYPPVKKTGILDSNYTWPEPLELDLGYNWSVRACDNEPLCSNWSNSRNFSIMPYVSINLTTNETRFGTVTHKEIKNTTLWDPISNPSQPSPFIVENIGNVETNISVNAVQSLWSAAGAGLGTSYFQFMAGNTSEKNSFDWVGSEINWTNMSDTQKGVIKRIGYNITNNSAEIEFRIEVHEYESRGDKSTKIIVVGERSWDQE